MSYDNASHNSQLPLIPGDDGWGDAAGEQYGINEVPGGGFIINKQ